MSIFSRLTDIINSNLNAMLDKAEDPEKIIRLIIQEMEDTLVEVRSSAARSIAEKKELSRRAERLRRELVDWEQRAQTAVEKGRDDLARAALVEQARHEDRIAQIDAELVHVEEVLTKYSEDIGQLQIKLKDAKSRQQTMVRRRNSADSQMKVRKHLDDGRVDDAMLRFEQYERKLDDLEGAVEAQDMGRQPTLKEQIDDLQHNDRIEQALNKLKNKLGG